MLLRYERHDTDDVRAGTDVALIRAGYATVTPLVGIERAAAAEGAAAVIDAALASIGSSS